MRKMRGGEEKVESLRDISHLYFSDTLCLSRIFTNLSNSLPTGAEGDLNSLKQFVFEEEE